MRTLLTIRPPEGDTYSIGIDGDRFADPDDTMDQRIDTSGLWALPGLADAHTHLTMTSADDLKGITQDTMKENIPAMAWAHVENGVLLILDKGGGSDLNLTSLDHDADLRPYIEVAGSMIHPRDGYAPDFGAEVEPEDLVEFVRTQAQPKGGWVKIIGDWPRRGRGPVTNYPVEILTEAVKVVHAAGARVAVHTMAASASDAVQAGVDSIEHGPFLTPDDLATLGRRGGAWVPTVVNMLYFAGLLGPESSGGKMFLRGLENMRENLPLAERLGVTVLAGTDMAVPHGKVAIEAMRLKEYGLSDRAATEATSTSAYGYVGRSDSIRQGETADVVFFKENPYESVATLRDPQLIIRRGNIIGETP